MKVQIYIKGGISGNRTISNAIANGDYYGSGQFGSLIINFNTMKEAKEELRKAYWRLKKEEPDYDMITKSKDNTYLSYDASTAKIIKLN